jgi:hypothetical protein
LARSIQNTEYVTGKKTKRKTVLLKSIAW